MARTGRPPKSAEQHRRDGTARKDRHSDTPLLVGGRVKPVAPKRLSKLERKHFSDIVDELWNGNIIDKADSRMIELAAIQGATIEHCCKDIDKRGYSVTVEKGGYQGAPLRESVEINPSVGIRDKAISSQRQILDLLGIGPSARARLGNAGFKGREPAKEVPGLATVRRLRAVSDGDKATG